MPIRGRNPDCVRIAVGEHGSVKMCAELVLRFGYGEIVPWVRKLGDGSLRAIAGPDMVVLRTPVHLRGENMKTVGAFTVSEGDRVPFVLSYGPSHLPIPKRSPPTRAERHREFLERVVAQGPERRAVVGRDLPLADHLEGADLRADRRHGGGADHVAAERIGGNRNWDYRYCWVRDATLTLLALMNAGYFEEAQAWRDWLTRAGRGEA
jgi:hypothetical protein